VALVTAVEHQTRKYDRGETSQTKISARDPEDLGRMTPHANASNGFRDGSRGLPHRYQSTYKYSCTPMHPIAT